MFIKRSNGILKIRNKKVGGKIRGKGIVKADNVEMDIDEEDVYNDNLNKLKKKLRNVSISAPKSSMGAGGRRKLFKI